MPEEQVRFSKRIVKLLGLTSAALRQKIAAVRVASVGQGQGQGKAMDNARTVSRAQRPDQLRRPARCAKMGQVTGDVNLSLLLIGAVLEGLD
jgi:hypothetical protein